MTEDEYRTALRAFVAEEFLQGAEAEALTDSTPLVESGILDSLRIAVLLGFLRDSLGVAVPLEKIDAHNFKDIATIAGVLAGAVTVPAGDRRLG